MNSSILLKPYLRNLDADVAMFDTCTNVLDKTVDTVLMVKQMKRCQL